MLDHIYLRRVLFLDIETVPEQPNLSDLEPEMQALWQYKTGRFQKPEDEPQDYYFQKAGVYAEFGKIICISVGFFAKTKNNNQEEPPQETFRIKTFYGDDEKQVLNDFLALLNAHFNNPYRFYLCGHNIREFDIPFICRRALIHGLSLPRMLDVPSLKPWEIPYIDTMKIWKFGDYKNFTSLHLLTKLLQIPSPKGDLEGKDVGRVYWREKDLERIVKYCQQDVLAVARLVQKFKGFSPMTTEQVIFVEESNGDAPTP